MAEAFLDIVKKEYNFTLYRGTTFGTGDMEIKNAAGEDVDISSDFTATMGIRPDIDSAAIADQDDVDWSYGDGTLSFLILSGDSDAEALAVGKYVYDILITDDVNASATIVAFGTFEIKEIAARADA